MESDLSVPDHSFDGFMNGRKVQRSSRTISFFRMFCFFYKFFEGTKLLSVLATYRVGVLSVPVLSPFILVPGQPFELARVSSVRASKSDDKRLSIFTGTKTLHLRCVSKEDRAAWIEALLTSKDLFPRVFTSNDLVPSEEIVVSTDNLRRRMLQEGIEEPIIKDCESIVLSEVSELQTKFKTLQCKHVILLHTLRRLESFLNLMSKKVKCWRHPLKRIEVASTDGSNLVGGLEVEFRFKLYLGLGVLNDGSIPHISCLRTARLQAFGQDATLKKTC